MRNETIQAIGITFALILLMSSPVILAGFLYAMSQ